jgi:UDP-perosamine 4-acetyltransferase
MTTGGPVVIVGAGGHAKVIIDLLQERGEIELAGCVSRESGEVLGLPWLGDDDALPGILASGLRRAFVAIGDNRLRSELLRRLTGLGFAMVNAISSQAVVSRRAALGTCVAVMPGAVVNVDTIVEDGAIINTSAHVDHDCRIGACAHIGPGTALAGNVTIGEGAFLGVGSRVIPRRTVGAWSTLGAGAVVVRDIPSHVTAVGVPARVTQGADSKHEPAETHSSGRSDP